MTGFYFAWNADRILSQGWEYGAPAVAIAVSAVLLLLITEAVRRTGGGMLAAIVLVVALYPVVADKMPGPLSGIAQSLPDTIAYHIVSSESAYGIPLKAFGELVVGFIVFGVALNYTGAGKFFNDIAFAMVGHIRGGAAQVGVVSSHFQRDLQRRHHHPRHETHRLLRGLRRRSGVRGLDRRHDHAARDGIDSLHHGLVPRHALRRNSAGGDHSRPPILFRPDGADRRLRRAPQPARPHCRRAAALRRHHP
jgi:hypothetical protein